MKLRPLPGRYTKPRWTYLAQDKEGMMHIDGVSVEELKKKYGTPLYILIESELRKRFRRFQGAFKDYPKMRNQYACKINTNLEILNIAREEGFEIDASSIGEILLALLANITPDQITLTNLYKSVQDIQFAAEIGVHAITMDSMEELERTITVGEKMKKRIPILIRVNPLLKLGSYSTVQHQYGIPITSVKKVIRTAIDSDWIELKGFHFHGGYIFHPRVYVAAAEKLLKLYKYAYDYGAKPDVIDLGGGFPADYSYRKGFTPEEMGPKFVKKFTRMVEKLNVPLPTLVFEPGKFNTTNAMIGLVKVVSVKDIGSKTIAVTDGSTYGFVPDVLVYNWRYDILPANKIKKPRRHMYRVCGCTCDSIDVIRKNTYLPVTEAGDLLAIMDVGAYSNVMSSNFNTLKRAPIVMICEDGTTRVIRRRDRYSEMFAPELDVSKKSNSKILNKLYHLHRRDIEKIWKGHQPEESRNLESLFGILSSS